MFYLNRLLAATFLLILSSAAVFAQRDRDTWSGGLTTEVMGIVRLADSNAPARNVTVRLERQSGGIIDQMQTDSGGKFRFQGIARGAYTVTVTADGYMTAQQQADVQVNLRAYLVIELAPSKSASIPTQPPMVLDARVPLEAQKEFELGRSALALKDSKTALEHLEKAIALYSDFYEAQLLIGTTYMNEGKIKEAELALKRATELKPESAQALLALGEVYRRKKRYAEAIEALEKGLKLDENSWQGYFTLGRVYWETGEVRLAAAPLGHTLQLKPDFAEAHLLAGNILLKLNAPERALFEYEEYLRLAPKGEFADETQQLVQKLKKAIKSK